jgi:hypothetical protein
VYTLTNVLKYTFIPSTEQISMICCLHQTPLDETSVKIVALIQTTKKVEWIECKTYIQCPEELKEPNNQNGVKRDETLPLVATTCLISGGTDKFCIYSSKTNAIYLWDVQFSVGEVKMNYVCSFQVFSSVFSLLITRSHIILGKTSCIHIYNLKQRKKEKDKLGRCIYLPRKEQVMVEKERIVGL